MLTTNGNYIEGVYHNIEKTTLEWTDKFAEVLPSLSWIFKPFPEPLMNGTAE